MLRRWLVVAALVVSAVIGLNMTASAQTAPGAGPDNALTPDGAWTKLAANSEHWYVFSEEGDEEAVDVNMQMVPNDAVSFEVWTQENLRSWVNEEEFEPVGRSSRSCGCDPEDELGRFSWLGSFVNAGEYYVVVKNEADDTSYYTLDVKGKEVHFPDAPVAMEPAPETSVAAMAAAPAMTEAPVAMTEKAGESPFFAMPVSEEWTDLNPGAQHWYAFTYDFDETYGPLEVLVYASPPQSAVVTIRNEDQARLWTQDGTEKHVGCCTNVNIDNKVYDDEGEDFDVDKFYGDKTVDAPFMRWAANNLASGKYYIVVSPAAGMTEDISYRLEVLGEGVFSEQATVEPAAEPAATLPAAASAMGAATQAARAGESPALAMPITTEWMSVEADAPHWYAFTYDADDTYGPLDLRVYADPAKSAVVTVRNEDQARLWAQTGEDMHFGCCTNLNIDNKVYDNEGEDFDVDKFYGDETVQAPYMRWAADDLASGQYYIVVALAEGEQGPAMYRLELSGEGVDS